MSSYIRSGELESLRGLGEMRTWVRLENASSGEYIEGWENETWAKLEKEGRLDEPWVEKVREQREYTSAGSKAASWFKENLPTMVDMFKPDQQAPRSPAAPAPVKKAGMGNIIMIGGIIAAVGTAIWLTMKK